MPKFSPGGAHAPLAWCDDQQRQRCTQRIIISNCPSDIEKIVFFLLWSGNDTVSFQFTKWRNVFLFAIRWENDNLTHESLNKNRNNMEEVHLRHTLALIAEDAALWLTPSCPKPRRVDQSLQWHRSTMLWKNGERKTTCSFGKTSLNVPAHSTTTLTANEWLQVWKCRSLGSRSGGLSWDPVSCLVNLEALLIKLCYPVSEDNTPDTFILDMYNTTVH